MKQAFQRWFRGWLPSFSSLRRAVRVPVVATLKGRASLYTLEVRRTRGGSDELVPDPRMQIQQDDEFTAAVTRAEEWVRSRRGYYWGSRRLWTITWLLTDERNEPVTGELRDGSLGAALATAMAFVLGLGRHARRRVDPDAVISAQLVEDGELCSVTGLEAKVPALARRRLRLMVAAGDIDVAVNARAGAHPSIVAGTRASHALSFAAAPRYRSLPVTLVAVLLVGVAIAWFAYQGAEVSRAERERQVQDLVALSRHHSADDPAASALAAVAAATLNGNDPTAQASLLKATTIDTRFAGAVMHRTTAVAISPDGAMVAAGTGNHGVKLRRTDRTAAERTSQAGGGSVTALVFTPDGKTIVSTDELGLVVRWDVASLTPVVLRKPEPYERRQEPFLAMSPDGQRVAMADARQRILVIELVPQAQARELSATSGTPAAMIFATADMLVVGRVGRAIKDPLLTFDLREQDPAAKVILEQKGHTFVVGVAALDRSADGKTLFSGGVDRRVITWDAQTLAQRGSFTADDAVVDVQVDARGTTALITTMAGLGLSTSIDRDNGDASTSLWDLGNGKPLSARLAGDFLTARVAADDDLQSAVVRGAGGAATLWSDINGNHLRQDGLVVDIEPDPLEPSGVVTAGQNGRIDFVDARSSRVTRSLPPVGHGALMGLSISRDGQVLATCHADGTVLLRDRGTGALIGEPLTTGGEPVFRVEFSPAGNLLAAGGDDGVVRLWEATTGKETRRWTTGANVIHQVAFDSAGERIYVADSRLLNGAIRGGLWWASTASDEIHDRQDTDFPTRGMVPLDAGRLLVGDGDGTIRITDATLRTTAPLVPFRHGSNVLAIARSPRGDRIITGSADNTSTVLRGSDLAPMTTIPGEDTALDRDALRGIYAVAVTNDARYAFLGSAEGRVQVIRLDGNDLAHQACALAGVSPGAEQPHMSDSEATTVGTPC